jgi:hypothetical protein
VRLLRGRGCFGRGRRVGWTGCFLRWGLRGRWLAFRHRSVSRVDDLHPAVLVGERIFLVLELLLAEADHRKPAFIDLVSLDQEGLHRRDAARRYDSARLYSSLPLASV